MRLSYGTHRAQVGDLWLPRRPAGASGAGADVPVVVLVHGGFWRAQFTKPLMTRMAKALAERGWAAWNIEYRRLGPLGGGGGWPATFCDVGAAVDHLARVDGVDLSRVVTCGHSAGGHLGVWAAARHRLPSGAPASPPVVQPVAAVSLAGILDLSEADRLDLGGGAASLLLGGHAAQLPDVYAQASPAELLPLGIPQVVVHGNLDTAVPQAMSVAYVERARAAGDDVDYLGLAGVGHRELIDPRGPVWNALVARLERLLAP
jgi:acetyl esterase/lipase